VAKVKIKWQMRLKHKTRRWHVFQKMQWCRLYLLNGSMLLLQLKEQDIPIRSAPKKGKLLKTLADRAIAENYRKKLI
jgi:hypothetical protein